MYIAIHMHNKTENAIMAYISKETLLISDVDKIYLPDRLIVAVVPFNELSLSSLSVLLFIKNKCR